MIDLKMSSQNEVTTNKKQLFNFQAVAISFTTIP